jgi:glycosyltransferase involved in cell wall biosynthesis
MKNISFIIPALNEEKTIGQCILSIQSQIKYLALCHNIQTEIIVVDNGSDDKTVPYAETFNVRVIHEPRKGVTRARQTGYKAAKYELQAYIDADNTLTDSWLKQLENLEQNDVVALSGPVKFYDRGFATNAMAWLFYRVAMLCHVVIGPSMQGGNFVVKRDALDQIDGHSVDIDFYGEDTDIALRLSRVGKVKLCPEMQVSTSSRRFNGQGMLKTTFIYALNYLSIHLLNRPVTLTHENYRG